MKYKPGTRESHCPVCPVPTRYSINLTIQEVKLSIWVAQVVSPHVSKVVHGPLLKLTDYRYKILPKTELSTEKERYLNNLNFV